MANSVLPILSISYDDEPLLRTQQWILETAGFKVTSALGIVQTSPEPRNRK